MSNEEKPNPSSRDTGTDRFQPKLFFIWFIIVLMIVLLLTQTEQTSGPGRQLTITELIAEAREGNVESLTLKEDADGGRNWYSLKGELKNPEYDPEAPPPAEGQPDPKPMARRKTIPFKAEGRITDERFHELEDLVPPSAFNEIPAGHWMRAMFFNVIMILLVLGLLYFLFVRQLRMAGKGAMSFGKSKARMLTRDKERALFKDVAGCDEAKEEVTEIVQFLKNPRKFQQIGGRIPKGVLMVGPPGTGKTLLAKSIAGEADVPFFSISGSDFVEMFVGVGAARVRDMFEQGRRHAPCIIFIDEIDAVGRQRGAGLGGGNDEREQTLNSLLVEMDGFDTQEGIIIMAATNRPDVLDHALLRPGRFDRQVTIDLPDLVGREAILRVHARKIKMSHDVDLTSVARATPGFAGADLANLLNEAALLAARYDKTEVCMAHVEEARDKIAFGRERRKLMDEEDRRSTAFHEAGHALVQAILKDKKMRLHKVTIIPRGSALGMTMASPTKDILGRSLNELRNEICMIMAGRIAEKIETGDISSGASGDIRMATQLARRMVCDLGMSSLGPVAYGSNQGSIFLAREITRQQDYSEETARLIDEEVRKIIKEQLDRAEILIRDHIAPLRKVAEALLEYETIEGKHVEEILEFGEIRSAVINTTNTGNSNNSDANDANSETIEAVPEDDPLGPHQEPSGAPA